MTRAYGVALLLAAVAVAVGLAWITARPRDTAEDRLVSAAERAYQRSACPRLDLTTVLGRRWERVIVVPPATPQWRVAAITKSVDIAPMGVPSSRALVVEEDRSGRVLGVVKIRRERLDVTPLALAYPHGITSHVVGVRAVPGTSRKVLTLVKAPRAAGTPRMCMP